MIKNSPRICIFVLIFLLSSAYGLAQSNQIRLRFEVDGKITKQSFKITFFVKGSATEAKVTKDGFLVPDNIGDVDRFAVRFESKKYELYFDPVFRKDLKADRIVGIDNKPFDKDIINSSVSYEGVVQLRYLRVRPTDGGMASILMVSY